MRVKANRHHLFRDHSPALNTTGELPWGPALGTLGFQAEGNIPWLSPASYNLWLFSLLTVPKSPSEGLARRNTAEG